MALLDLRERFDDFEELFRCAWDGFRKNVWTATPASVTEDSQDGHTTKAQSTVKGRVVDQDTGEVTYVDMPVHEDVPVSYASGGGHSFTHPVKKGDEGTIIYADRGIDNWHQQGGNQQPIDHRRMAMSDPIWIPSIRSDPRKLDKVSQVSSQQRADNGKHFTDVHEDNGVTHQSENLVLAQVGEVSSHLVQKSSIRSEAPKVLINC